MQLQRDEFVFTPLKFCFVLYRNRNLNWQSANPVIIVWYMCKLCYWLHAAPALCLLFKGLEISDLSFVFNKPSEPYHLVVGFNF